MTAASEVRVLFNNSKQTAEYAAFNGCVAEGLKAGTKPEVIIRNLAMSFLALDQDSEIVEVEKLSQSTHRGPARGAEPKPLTTFQVQLLPNVVLPSMAS